MHDAAHPLRDQVEPAAPGIGPVIAESRELGINQSPVHIAQLLPAEPGARHHRRPVILDENIDALDELQKQRPSLGLLVVERDALLVAIDVAEIGVALAAVAPGAHRVALARPFELQHLSPHIGEDHRAERPGHVFGQIEHPEPVQQPLVFAGHLGAPQPFTDSIVGRR